MSSKERDRFTERSKSPDLHKMKAVAMCSGSEEDTEKAGASSCDEQEGGDNQQSSLNRRFSAESQEFEFNKLGSGLTSPLRNEDQHHDLASADELFYKGQLLPLQYNTRAVPAFTSSETSSPISPWHDTIEIPSSKLSLSSLRDQDVQKFSSCRMDHVGLDTSLFEFNRSSSFRAHSSNNYCNYYANYGPNCSTGPWDSSTPTNCAGESSSSSSSSSSRDSNGSSQDSYSSSDHHKEQHICCHVHASAASVNGPFSPFPRRKPGIIQSWKVFFTGFRRSSQPTAACRDHDQAVHKSSFHGCSSTRRPAEANPQGANDQGSKPPVCECKLSKEKNGISERHSKAGFMWAQEKERGIRSNGNLNTGRDDDQSLSSCNKKDKELTRRGSFLRGSRWQGYTRRIKPISIMRATLVGGHSDYDHEIFPESSSLRAEQKSQPLRESAGRRPAREVTCQMPSLERRPSQPSLVSTLVSGVKGTSRVSFRFDTVPSSCPASVRSSPNHSGLLVVATPPANHSGPLITSPAFNNNMSTMQELHSAVQGAIAHCKQSISAPS